MEKGIVCLYLIEVFTKQRKRRLKSFYKAFYSNLYRKILGRSIGLKKRIRTFWKPIGAHTR